MGLMMYPVLIVLCVGVVYCEVTDRQVTVTPGTTVTSTTPTSSNSTSRVVIENKVQNLTVEYNSDHGQNTTFVVNQAPSNRSTGKPLIITTSKEIRLIQTPRLNDSIATATSQSNSNSSFRRPNELKHYSRANLKTDHAAHFLPTVRPESSPKFANLSKYATFSKNTNLTKVATQKGSVNPIQNQTDFLKNHNSNHHVLPQNPQIKHPAPRHVQNDKASSFNNHKSQKKNLNHASEIEMEKVEVKEMRYVESPKDSKQFRYYMVDDENEEKKPSTSPVSSQMFEMTFSGKSFQRNPNTEPKQMDKYKVRSKTYNNNQNYQNKAKPSNHSTTTPLQYLTPPPPTIYTVRPKITNVNNISITTSAPVHKELNAPNQLGAKVQTHAGPRDFSCLRCFGHNKPHKNFKYPSYPTKHDPMLDGNRAVKLLGPDGDNFLGGSKHHYVVAKPEAPRQTNGTSSTQKGHKPEVQGQTRPQTVKNPETPKKDPKRPAASKAPSKPDPITKRPESPNSKPQGLLQKPRNPYIMDGALGSYASPSVKRPEIFSVPEKSTYSVSKQIEDQTSRPPQKTRHPYLMDTFMGNQASSNVEFSVSRPNNIRSTSSPFKLDPSSDLYHLDDELQASASSVHKHHPNVKVETKEIHIPFPEIIETRVPYPIHIKVDRLVPVHIDKPYPVRVEKKVPVPVKINVPQPYPVEKEVPYPVKIPIEVPRPVEVAKPVPYLVENPVPVQVFKQVKVPIKVPVDVPVPYRVHVPVEKRVPFFVEKKVPFEVPVAVEKPYLVEVKKPFEVPQEKPQPVTVEKKIPVPVQVVEFVKVPIPVYPPHGQHSYQHRSGEMSMHHSEMPSAPSASDLVGIPIEQNQSQSDKQSAHDEIYSSRNQQSTRMHVVLPNEISVEFPADFGHQPSGPASGFVAAASNARVTQT